MPFINDLQLVSYRLAAHGDYGLSERRRIGKAVENLLPPALAELCTCV